MYSNLKIPRDNNEQISSTSPIWVSFLNSYLSQLKEVLNVSLSFYPVLLSDKDSLLIKTDKEKRLQFENLLTSIIDDPEIKEYIENISFAFLNTLDESFLPTFFETFLSFVMNELSILYPAYTDQFIFSLRELYKDIKFTSPSYPLFAKTEHYKSVPLKTNFLTNLYIQERFEGNVSKISDLTEIIEMVLPPYSSVNKLKISWEVEGAGHLLIIDFNLSNLMTNMGIKEMPVLFLSMNELQDMMRREQSKINPIKSLSHILNKV